MAVVGSLRLSCGVGRRLQDRRLVERVLADVACSPENEVSLYHVGGLHITTSLQHRRDSLNMKETTKIHPRFSIMVISCLYLYLYFFFTFLYVSCHIGLLT
jgi:hypothetical protein